MWIEVGGIGTLDEIDIVAPFGKAKEGCVATLLCRQRDAQRALYVAAV